MAGRQHEDPILGRDSETLLARAAPVKREEERRPEPEPRPARRPRRRPRAAAGSWSG